MASDKDQLDRVFTDLVSQHQDRLYGYVYAIVQNVADAEDLVQRTVLTLWRRFGDFEQGTDFAAWALKTARYEVLNFRRSGQRRMMFAEDLITRLSDVALAETQAEEDAARRLALRECVEELPENDRQLLDSRYEEDQTLKQISARLSRSEQSLSNSLSRIRQRLFECIGRKLAQEAQP